MGHRAWHTAPDLARRARLHSRYPRKDRLNLVTAAARELLC